MVNFRKLSARAEKAKDLIDKQGGTDALKEKADRIKGIAQGKGSVSDKAKAAARKRLAALDALASPESARPQPQSSDREAGVNQLPPSGKASP